MIEDMQLLVVEKSATHILHIKLESVRKYYTQEYLTESLLALLERNTRWKHYKDMLFYSNNPYSTEILDINLQNNIRNFVLKEQKLMTKGSSLLEVDLSYTIRQIQETNFRKIRLSDLLNMT